MLSVAWRGGCPRVFADEEAIETSLVAVALPFLDPVREYSLTKKRLRLISSIAPR